MSQVAHTTEMLFQGSDYFVALLDNGGVTIGLKEMFRNDFPAGHEMVDMIVALGNSGDADRIEEVCDEIYSIHRQGGDCRVMLTA